MVTIAYAGHLILTLGMEETFRQNIMTLTTIENLLTILTDSLYMTKKSMIAIQESHILIPESTHEQVM